MSLPATDISARTRSDISGCTRTESSAHQQSMVAAMIRTIFAQPDAGHVERQVKEVAATMKRQFSVVNEMLLDATEDLTAFRHFPTNHW